MKANITMISEEKSGGSFSLREWAETKPENFNVESEFRAVVEPMIDALMAKCAELGIPASVVASYKQDESGTNYCRQAYKPGAARTPRLVLAADHAANGDLEGVQIVAIASNIRQARAKQTTH